jgi:hypothetical protein
MRNHEKLEKYFGVRIKFISAFFDEESLKLEQAYTSFKNPFLTGKSAKYFI